MSSNLPLQCVVVDDHAVLRRALCFWLESIFPKAEFIGFGNGEDAVDFACRHSPRVMLIDLHMPDMDGIEATRRIKSCCPQVFIVIHTMQEAAAVRDAAEAAGADALVTKGSPEAELISILSPFFS